MFTLVYKKGDENIKHLFNFINSELLFSLMLILYMLSLVMFYAEALWDIGWKISLVLFIVASVLYFVALYVHDKEEEERRNRK